MWTEYSQERILDLFSLSRSTFFGWFDEFGNIIPPKDRKPSNPKTVLKSEIEAVINYRLLHKDVGYRKLTWMMIDENICCITESATYEILKKHNRLYGWNSVPGEPAKKEYTQKPKYVHDHWHTDIAYIKIAGVFYFLIMVLDGHSRFLNTYAYTYNYQRLHAGIKFMRPADVFFNREQTITKERKDKLSFARKVRMESNGLWSAAMN